VREINIFPLLRFSLVLPLYDASNRFGKALFFEYPITNPFAHEERFQINVADPELRLVTAFDEWIHLRRACR